MKGGSEQQLLTPLPLDPLDPVDQLDQLDPVLCPKVWFRVRETILFESISGRHVSENGLKSRCFRWSCHEKVKKTLYRFVTSLALTVKTHIKCSKMNSSPDPADPAEVVAATAARTLPSTRAGGQDDGSYTNSLK